MTPPYGNLLHLNDFLVAICDNYVSCDIHLISRFIPFYSFVINYCGNFILYCADKYYFKPNIHHYHWFIYYFSWIFLLKLVNFIIFVHNFVIKNANFTHIIHSSMKDLDINVLPIFINNFISYSFCQVIL